MKDNKKKITSSLASSIALMLFVEGCSSDGSNPTTIDDTQPTPTEE